MSRRQPLHVLGFVALAVSPLGCSGGGPSARPTAAADLVARPSPGTAAAPDPGEDDATVVEVWQAAQLPRIRALRLSVAETPLDDAVKQRIGRALREHEASLRRIVADARRDPLKAGAALERMRRFREEREPGIEKLFSAQQYDSVSRRNRAVEDQLFTLATDPAEFVRRLSDAFALTAEQKAKFTPAVDRLANRLRGLEAELERADARGDHEGLMNAMVNGQDELVALAVVARSHVRAALAADQLKRFEAEFPSPPPDPPDPAGTPSPQSGGSATRPGE